ncbi:hypothetical protein NDU88_003469 [Pleurodeles waltl]|uniref:Uncharacterized protein n=1 Tax=Pleurodeles waltl TaxID=8319 RepID=A0AAV7KVL7_PLEWA|nr:hypothetical protein NDU88_003469 [Pleurodeles waltl]
MATGTGRFRVATPRSGQSMVILGCLGHREFHHWRLGAPGQQSLTLRLCVPQGVQKRQVPHWAATCGPSSPRPFSVCSPAVGRHQAPPPGWEADSSPAGAHTRRSGLPPSLQGGPVTGFGAGRCVLPGSGPRPQSADDLPGLGPRQGTRVRWGCPWGNGLAQAASPVIAAHLPRCSGSGSLPVQHDPAPPIDRAAASPQPRAAPAARVSAPGARPQLRCLPPSTAVVSLFSECNTARPSASRHKFVVGPSGAERLSVRHARLHGHAPLDGLRHYGQVTK